MAVETVKTIVVKNDTLVCHQKLFKNGDELSGYLAVEYDIFSVMDGPERPIQLIAFDSKKKIISLPVLDSKDRLIKSRLYYRCNSLHSLRN